MAQNVYGVDFGTNNIKIYNKSNDTIFNEKNVIAIKDKKEIYAIGDEAFEMYEKAPSNIVVSYPVRNGVIADFNNMATLFDSMLDKIKKTKSARTSGAPIVCIAVPYDITGVEKRAFQDLTNNSKVKTKNIVIVEKPIADAVGVGIDVNAAKGSMVVNIGADTTEISVISLGGMVLSKLIKIGGNKFDEAIQNIVKKKYNLHIGKKTAEQLKMKLASATKCEEDKVNVFGRDLVTGLPTNMDISSTLIYEAIEENLRTIVDSIKIILERTPPELAADIIDEGIYLTGGSSNIKNLDQLIKRETDLSVNISENPSESVARGLKLIATDREYSDLAYKMKAKVYN